MTAQMELTYSIKVPIAMLQTQPLISIDESAKSDVDVSVP